MKDIELNKLEEDIDKNYTLFIVLSAIGILILIGLSMLYNQEKDIPKLPILIAGTFMAIAMIPCIRLIIDAFRVPGE